MLVRDSNDGVQVFLMKRAKKSNFGGIWVFPGGILEEQDDNMSTSDYCYGICETKPKRSWTMIMNLCPIGLRP